MTPRHAALEATLKALADDFASRVALAMVNAPVTELRDAFDTGELRRALLVALSHLAVESVPRRAARLKPPMRVVRPSRGAAIDQRKKPPSDDGGAATITDPGLLLLAMEQERRTPVSYAAPARASAAPLMDRGPTLRPGERLQRTTGGGLVLRRPGR